MSAAAHLRVVDTATADNGYLDMVTPQGRRFLGMPDGEATELTIFVEGRIMVAHATDIENHVRLLREAERIRGFNGAYQLVNGPMDPALLARYPSNQIVKGWNGRVTDKDIGTRRAVFLDIDPVRPKGISSTDEQLQEASDIANRVEEYLSVELGAGAIGRGLSGNGVFILIALEPRSNDPADVPKISAFLKALNTEFGNDRVKIDQTVANAARLMPAPGTMKRKGQNTAERPHRRTSFCCRANITRVPLEAIAT